MYSVSRKSISIPLTLLLCAISALAQGQQGTSAALFPKTNEIAGWSLKEAPKFFNNDRLFDYMDGAAEIPKSYAFTQLGTAKYQKAANLVLEVAVFNMTKPEDAFGYYSARVFLEHSGKSKDRIVPLDHPAHLYSAVGALTFWKDRYTVIVQPEIGRPDDATLIQFAKVISAKIKAKGSPPALLARLPAEKQVTASARYVRGKATFDATIMFLSQDVFGIGNKPEVAAAEYTLPGKSVTLFLIRYPTAKAATAAYDAYRQYLTAHKAVFAPKNPTGSYIAMATKEKGTGVMTRGNLLGAVIGAKDAATAAIALKSLAGKTK